MQLSVFAAQIERARRPSRQCRQNNSRMALTRKQQNIFVVHNTHKVDTIIYEYISTKCFPIEIGANFRFVKEEKIKFGNILKPVKTSLQLI